MTDASGVVDVREDAFGREVLDASRTVPVVVDFWAPWCGPCRQLSPLLERVAARHSDVKVVKVNIDEAQSVARALRVQSIPAVMAFRDGKVVDQFVGLQPEAVIERLFSRVGPSPADRLVTQALAAEGPERERLLREALEDEPGHAGAIVALARVLVERQEIDDALALLARVPNDEAARRLAAQLRLVEGARGDARDELRARWEQGDGHAGVRLGRALAARGAYEQALGVLVEAVRDPDVREEARNAAVEVFAVLGEDDPLVHAWRRKLAAALF